MSSEQVRNKANYLGLKKVGIAPARAWSRQEVTLLSKMYPDNTVLSIARQLGRTVTMVEGKVQYLGIRKMNPVWSNRELNLLRKLYPSKTAQQIADKIGRSVQATRMRIVKLGLKKRSHKTKT